MNQEEVIKFKGLLVYFACLWLPGGKLPIFMEEFKGIQVKITSDSPPSLNSTTYKNHDKNNKNKIKIRKFFCKGVYLFAFNSIGKVHVLYITSDNRQI